MALAWSADRGTCTDDACEPEAGCTRTAVKCDAGYVCVEGGCEVVRDPMDTDEDGKIGLTDYAVWQDCFRGPGE